MDNMPYNIRFEEKESINLSDRLGRKGMRNIGRLTLTSSCTSSPSFLWSKTRPATLRSLSNHVCHIPDPHVFTWTCKKLLFEKWETSVNLGQGLSVCAATTWNPLPSLYLHSPVKTPKKDEEDIPIQRHCLPSWYNLNITVKKLWAGNEGILIHEHRSKFCTKRRKLTDCEGRHFMC